MLARACAAAGRARRLRGRRCRSARRRRRTCTPRSCALGAALAGALWRWQDRTPAAVAHGVVVLATLCVTGAVAASTTPAGIAVGALGFVWVTLFSAVFHDRRSMLGHLALTLSGLARGPRCSPARPRPLQTWTFVGVTACMVAGVVNSDVTRLRDRADLDALTGTLTRAAFRCRAEQAMDEARRRGEPLALVLLDLDDFKRVNDAHGHAAGDRVLSALTDQWRSAPGERRPARPARRRRVRPAAPLGHRRGRPARRSAGSGRPPPPERGPPGSAPWVGDDLDEWLARADADLYRRKHSRPARRALTPGRAPPVDAPRPAPWRDSRGARPGDRRGQHQRQDRPRARGPGRRHGAREVAVRSAATPAHPDALVRRRPRPRARHPRRAARARSRSGSRPWPRPGPRSTPGGAALTDLVRWDGRSGDEDVAHLVDRRGRAELFAATGVRASAKVPLVTWAWLRRTRPDLWRRVAPVGRRRGPRRPRRSPGELVTDHTLAGRTMAYLLPPPGDPLGRRSTRTCSRRSGSTRGSCRASPAPGSPPASWPTAGSSPPGCPPAPRRRGRPRPRRRGLGRRVRASRATGRTRSGPRRRSSRSSGARWTAPAVAARGHEPRAHRGRRRTRRCSPGSRPPARWSRGGCATVLPGRTADDVVPRAAPGAPSGLVVLPYPHGRQCPRPDPAARVRVVDVRGRRRVGRRAALRCRPGAVPPGRGAAPTVGDARGARAATRAGCSTRSAGSRGRAGARRRRRSCVLGGCGRRQRGLDGAQGGGVGRPAAPRRGGRAGRHRSGPARRGPGSVSSRRARCACRRGRRRPGGTPGADRAGSSRPRPASPAGRGAAAVARRSRRSDRQPPDRSSGVIRIVR